MSDTNTGQIAVGYEASQAPLDVPYTGPAVHDHIGRESLNQAFMMGASFGRDSGGM